METISGTASWQLTIQRTADSVTILRAATCDKTAALPDSVFGLPVTCLADHAFAPSLPETEGEQVEIRHGIPSGPFDNGSLEELFLPDTIKRIESYAFMKCRELKSLHLWDEIEYFGSDIFMNCRSLSSVEINRSSEKQGEALAYIVKGITRELDVTVRQSNGETIRLIFPEYFEKLTENEPTHFFNFTIEGGGYPYHSVFVRNRLDLNQYDSLWEKYISGPHEEETALRLAWMRLKYPAGLSGEYREKYWEYIRLRIRKALLMVLESGDIAGLQLLLDQREVQPEDLSAAADKARNEHKTEALTLLLETRHRRFSGEMRKKYDL
ncbi:MAG: leucine-rich repeat domain-containing protein [Eubacteriales bacterium]|nr:leucine-rich repeat domain-containing protein [Eubacteriales bacterium]